MLDWDDLRFFLEIARHRSLAAAARKLNVTQSTVGRRLSSLEIRIGVRLLHRVADGFVLTLAGKAVLENVERIENEAHLVERTIAGHDSRTAAVVRVTASQLVTSHLITPSLAGLHQLDQTILIELVSLAPGAGVELNEADVALQLLPFQHQDLVVRKIGLLKFGLYGSTRYLERRGNPEDGCAGHQLIAMLDDRELSAQASWFGNYGRRADVVLRSDCYESQYWAAASGIGLAVLPRFRGDADKGLRLLEPAPQAEIWLGVSREKRQNARVRTVLDCISNGVKRKANTLYPIGADDATVSDSFESAR